MIGMLQRRAAVNIWWIGLADAAAREAANRAMLSEEERARADQYDPIARQRFTLSQAALRAILGRQLGRSPAGLRFERTVAGKPQLPDAPLQFTLAHSCDWAVVAVAERTVGIDLERIAPVPELDSVMARFFSARERADLSALPAEKRLHAFHHCWCCKEAYLKALGCGLAMAPASFTVAVAPAAPALLASPFGELECRRWRFVRLAAPRRYAAALAIEGPPPVLAEHVWQAE